MALEEFPRIYCISMMEFYYCPPLLALLDFCAAPSLLRRRLALLSAVPREDLALLYMSSLIAIWL
jgi:hypothetical protein